MFYFNSCVGYRAYITDCMVSRTHRIISHLDTSSRYIGTGRCRGGEQVVTMEMADFPVSLAPHYDGGGVTLLNDDGAHRAGLTALFYSYVPHNHGRVIGRRSRVVLCFPFQ